MLNKPNRRAFPLSLRKLISSTGPQNFPKKCLMVPKNSKEGTLWASLSSNLLQKKITKEGTLWRHQANLEKVSQCRKKIVKPSELSVTTKL